MFAGTHALLPVCACLLVDKARGAMEKPSLFPPRVLVAVAVFGLLPDLCSPHLSAEARYRSGSHTVWFLAGVMPVVAIAAHRIHRDAWRATAVALWLATASHLAADAVSGGIPWAYPWSDSLLGTFFIHPDHWIWFDAAFIFAAWLLIRVFPPHP